MNSAMARLEVVAGRAIGMWVLIDDELLIGRHAEGAGRLADDEEISRSHARLSLDRTGFCAIEDLGSTNGTYVNGLRIAGPETLSEGDTIEVGGTTLVVRELPIPHSEHTLRAIPSRPTVIPGSAVAPAPDKTPPAGRHHVRPRPASRAPHKHSGRGRSPPRAHAQRRRDPAIRRVRSPTTCH
jgi:predicted component of type VI protein secretion system